jgi:copper(I)-binding protein
VRSTPPGSTVGTAYATLHNASTQALLISSVSSDVSTSAELHGMSMHDGVMRMRHLDSGLSLKAGETVQLQPGGLHLMLFGLQRPLRAGDTVLLHFRIFDGREISAAAPVRESVLEKNI